MKNCEKKDFVTENFYSTAMDLTISQKSPLYAKMDFFMLHA